MLFYYGSQQIILNSYLQLENQTISEAIERTQSALDQAINRVALSVQDWSISDDTKPTFAVSSLQNLKIDIMLYFDENGKLLHTTAVNQNRTAEVPPPAGLLETLTPKSKLINLQNIDSSLQGLLSIPSGILLIASHAVVNNQSKNSARGTLVMAKYLTNSVLANIENLTHVDTTIYRLPATDKIAEIDNAYKQLLSKNSPQAFVTLNQEDKLFGYKFLFDIDNNRIAILKIKMPHTIYNIGIQTIRYSNALVFAYSTVIIILLWILLQYLIVKRLEKLNRHVKKIGTSDKFFTQFIANVSDEVSSIAILYHQASHDPLTGLANRNLLHRAFNHVSAETSGANSKIVILFIDLDHLKRINNTMGHSVGDELLMLTAKRLNTSLRDNDVAARLGGDEFVVMLTDVDKTQVEAIANRIFKNVNRPFIHENHEVYVSSSMGVCIYPDDGNTIETLIKHADMALYHAKENGRNHYQFYSASLTLSISASHQNEIELQTALNEKQLCLYYQPIYDLRTKKIISLEALIRWNHPTQGLLGPNHIIPIAERTDLIYPIGDWVFRTACHQVKEWQDKGLRVVPVAVNVSSMQMKQSSLSETIISALQETSLDTHLLEIEITETGFVDVTPKLLNELEGLKASGIKLTIDDFGTGYSGLGYLKSLPVSKLKIDQSFIRDIETDPDDKSITLAIIAIAHQLNLRVTAEGVENIEQYNFMCYHQVDEAQGFLLSRPLSAEDCEKLLSGETGSEINKLYL